MGLTAWLLWFALDSAWAWWVVWHGGAQWLQGWKSWLLLNWWAARWNAEQIRLYVLLIWLLHAVWFVLGLLRPDWRW